MTQSSAALAGFKFDILPQPDDATCGPTCLHAIYRALGDTVSLDDLIQEIGTTPSGGTADVYLACDALRRGYKASIYTFNLRLFDPTWFEEGVDLAAKLRAQKEAKGSKAPMLAQLTDAYIEFLGLGGTVQFTDLTPALLRRHLKRGVPILTGLSSTYLYRHARTVADDDTADDVRGEPEGHFVVLCGYRPKGRNVVIADPYEANPLGSEHHYEVTLDRVIGAIMLGVLTHDASLLAIEHRRAPKPKAAE